MNVASELTGKLLRILPIKNSTKARTLGLRWRFYGYSVNARASITRP